MTAFGQTRAGRRNQRRKLLPGGGLGPAGLVFADGGEGGPRRQAEALALDGQGQQEHVEVVVGVLVGHHVAAAEAGSGAHPAGGNAHVVVDGSVDQDAGAETVAVAGVDGAGGVGGPEPGLHAHADLDVGAGHHPVEIGELGHDIGRAGAEHAAVLLGRGGVGGGAAPGIEAENGFIGGGQTFVHHEAGAQGEALDGAEVLGVKFLAGVVLDVGRALQGAPHVATVFEQQFKRAVGLHFHGGRGVERREHQARGEQQSCQLFHKPSLLKDG